MENNQPTIYHENQNYRSIEKKERIRKRIYLYSINILHIIIIIIYAKYHSQEELILVQNNQKAILEESFESQIRKYDRLYLQYNSRLLACKKIHQDALYTSQGKYKLTFESYDKAIKYGPLNPGGYGLKGYLLFYTKKYVDAINFLEDSVKIDSSIAWNHYNLSLAYWSVGQENNSINELKIVLSLDPSLKKIILSDRQFSKIRKSSKFIDFIENY
jgi:hypothetical protein